VNSSAVTGDRRPASEPDVCEVRDAAGNLLRKVDRAIAEELIEAGLGEAHGFHEVRLFQQGSNPRTWHGRMLNQHRGFGHNARVCDGYGPGRAG
jgi:hypothetical protein